MKNIFILLRTLVGPEHWSNIHLFGLSFRKGCSLFRFFFDSFLNYTSTNNCNKTAKYLFTFWFCIFLFHFSATLVFFKIAGIFTVTKQAISISPWTWVEQRYCFEVNSTSMIAPWSGKYFVTLKISLGMCPTNSPLLVTVFIANWSYGLLS